MPNPDTMMTDPTLRGAYARFLAEREKTEDPRARAEVQRALSLGLSALEGKLPADGKRYKFLLFDADNTVFDFTAGSKIAFHLAMAACGLAGGEETFAVYEKINVAHWKAFERGEITKEAIYSGRLQALSQALGVAIDIDRFDAVYKKVLGEQALLMPGADAVIRRLHAAGFRLFIITNGDTAVQKARFARSPLTPCFEQIFISETIGVAKPEAGFFSAVMEAIDGFDNERALVIGDSPSSDIQGAMNAGLDAVYFDPDMKPLPPGIEARYTIRALPDLLDLLGVEEGDASHVS